MKPPGDEKRKVAPTVRSTSDDPDEHTETTDLVRQTEGKSDLEETEKICSPNHIEANILVVSHCLLFLSGGDNSHQLGKVMFQGA